MDGEYNKPLLTRLVSIDEFKQYSGYDLEELLGDGALAFITRTQVRMKAFLQARLFINIDKLYPQFNDTQKECYKYALMEQMIYIIVNGDTSIIAGVSIDNKTVVKNEDLLKNKISSNAIEQLNNCGIWSLKMRDYGRDNILPPDLFGGGNDR